MENQDVSRAPAGPALVQVWRADPQAARRELLAGLNAPEAVIAPKYFYDALGSQLFAAITQLPEYYPTRTEAAIYQDHVAEMAAAIRHLDTLVDLGAGNCEKAPWLFDALAIRRYVAVDISVEFLRDALARLQARYPDIAMLGVGQDFSASLNLPAQAGSGPRLLFYPGSSIGNFAPAAALTLLRNMHAACQGGGALIGVDLVKTADVLEQAYDDPLQVTAAFNRNVLRHLNQHVGSDFDIADWQHVAFFNKAASRIEMHLEAVRDVSVSWPGGGRRFSQGERILTEYSCKWTIGGFTTLLQQAGFTEVRYWTDARGWFAVFAAQA